MTGAVQFTGVSKWFFHRTVNQVQALANINLTIPGGQWVTVIGSNGAGKSTLLRMLSGEARPDIGNIHVDGVDITRWPDYRRANLLGRIDQDPMASTAPEMTIEENLAIALKRGERRGLAMGVTAARRELFRTLLKEVGLGLEKRLRTPVGNLSGGQRQALALIMSTVTRPRVLILDEHTAALDPKAAELVINLTRDMVHKFSLTTLMVTHNMEQAIKWGDRLLMMHQGRIILEAAGPEKANLTVLELVQRFNDLSGQALKDDRILLA